MCSKVSFTLKLLIAVALATGMGRIFAAASPTVSVDGIESRVFSGHSGRVTSASFSPDGKLLVTASIDGTVRVWDISTGGVLCEFKAGDNKFSTAHFSGDGQLVKATSGDGEVFVWDVHTGALKDNWEESILEDFILAKSPDGALMVAVIPWGGAVVSHMPTKKVMHQLGPALSVNAAQFSHDGLLIAIILHDGLVRVIDVSTGSVRYTLPGHNAAFSHDDRLIITASDDRAARIWDVATGTLMRILTGHEKLVCFASFSPDDKSIVTASCDRTVRLWRDVRAQQQAKLVAFMLACAQHARLGQDSPAQLLQPNTLQDVVDLVPVNRFERTERAEQSGLYFRTLAIAW